MLRKRAEFLKVRGGARWATPAFVMEARSRDGDTGSKDGGEGAAAAPRFGFTVTKRIGNAVVRNRIRRRLREALRRMVGVQAVTDAEASRHVMPGHDYVLIARSAAAERPFDQLLKDLAMAFERTARPRREGRPAASRGVAKGHDERGGERGT
ncbi:MAG: ribonuclease P protein component [Hyphomicrobiaceae bacterium]